MNQAGAPSRPEAPASAFRGRADPAVLPHSEFTEVLGKETQRENPTSNEVGRGQGHEQQRAMLWLGLHCDVGRAPSRVHHALSTSGATVLWAGVGGAERCLDHARAASEFGGDAPDGKVLVRFGDGTLAVPGVREHVLPGLFHELPG